jgi:6-phosphofructokinase 2
MPRIVTLTLNPAVDASTRVGHVISERKLRCGPLRYEPGGGGINVSRVLRRLGEDAPAIYPSGGPGGALLARLLDAEGVTRWPIEISGWTRENLNVQEGASGRQYRFCMPGPELTASELERCLDRLRRVSPTPTYLVASGSLPPRVPADTYAAVARSARADRTRLVLDASGDALRRAVSEGVYLLKASLREFEELTGASGADEPRLIDLAREIVRNGGCEILVLSLGSGGALWATGSQAERVLAPAVPVSSGVGAGDSLVAAIVLALARGRGVGDAVAYGVAAGAASVMRPGTALCLPEDVERLSVGRVTPSAPAPEATRG